MYKVGAFKLLVVRLQPSMDSLYFSILMCSLINKFIVTVIPIFAKLIFLHVVITFSILFTEGCIVTVRSSKVLTLFTCKQ